MDSSSAAQHDAPIFALFGSLALSFNASAFDKLCADVKTNPNFQWAKAAINDLAQQWKSVATLAGLGSSDTDTGAKEMSTLVEAFNSADARQLQFPLSNKLLVPLVVLYQLESYASFCTSSKVPVATSGVLGFCTGLLGAFAVASSPSITDLEKFGSNAIRLGMLVGTIADLPISDDKGNAIGPARSIGTEWKDEEKTRHLHDILENNRPSYISVQYDSSRATITAPANTTPTLLKQLRESGIVASEIGLRGRYHSQQNLPLLQTLFDFCATHPAFQLQDAAETTIATYNNHDGSPVTSGPLHEHALRSILVDQSLWIDTWKGLIDRETINKQTRIVSTGYERAIPPSLIKQFTPQTTHLLDKEKLGNVRQQDEYLDTDIAVVGMSCKTAGADNIDEFWEVLSTGKSQHREIKPDDKRFSFKTLFREVDPKRKWFGNFIDDVDCFDHKFFKTSPRESATTDPQQRHLLQVAYQAVEQSGYFHKQPLKTENANIGCYIGLCGTDYENNIACHPANAFAATGNLEAFAAGKVSHYFGWTGPAMVVDTACSSSAVAIDMACKSILSGQCAAALAGGTAIMTSPYRFQNLAGASFLSQTGQCKPFDSKADGYCRGEGVGAVFLKKMSTALADGDQIFGVIAASGVQQNQNCTPIFVPNSPSLSDLFRNVLDRAHVDASQVGVVEAHGTGTAVGDPAEYESVKQVLAVKPREKQLVLGSVKGFIGHTEPTSGVLSLIKILLMMHHGKIPAQASHQTLNPTIKAVKSIVVPTSPLTWDSEFKAALINNYGASGSNASMVVLQAPRGRVVSKQSSSESKLAYPFWITSLDESGQKRKARALLKWLSQRSTASIQADEDAFLASLSYNLGRQSNRHLPHSLMFSANSFAQLTTRLQSLDSLNDQALTAKTPTKDVVLCFGGQVSTFVGLDKDLYHRVPLLRGHLQAVDTAAKTLGVESIFPDIFQQEAFDDPVRLQVALFAMQYACAKSWIDSGIKPGALIGHSFGELTALCVSGTLSLNDTIKAIVARAGLVRHSWGEDKGAMMAVEGSLETVDGILQQAAKLCEGESIAPASIACYNGPTSFTIAGSQRSVDIVAQVFSESSVSMRTKRLNVTNAFHCNLVEPLIDGLGKIGHQVTFQRPQIHLEHATEKPLDKISKNFFAQHMRSPVFFNHALARLQKKYPAAVFLEAGSNSTVTNMASRALGTSTGSRFHALNLRSNTQTAWNQLVDATIGLWRDGLHIQFWTHHGVAARQQHDALLLPPYSFDKSKHWLELKEPPAQQVIQTEKVVQPPKEELVYLVESSKSGPKYQINTQSAAYQKLVSGHIFASTAAICPATVQFDFVIEAIRSVQAADVAETWQPQLFDVKCQTPLCLDETRSHFIEFHNEETINQGLRWKFTLFSTQKNAKDSETVYTTGFISLLPPAQQHAIVEFDRLSRLVSHKQAHDMLYGGAAVDEVLSNRTIYRMFVDVVDYTEEYQGIQKLCSLGDTSAGLVSRKSELKGWLDPFVADYFCQVAGIWATCMTDCASTDMYVCNGVTHWFRNPRLTIKPQEFHVLALHRRPDARSIVSDIFVFDASNGELYEVVTGLSYYKVPRASMSKLLTRLSPHLPSQVTGTSTLAPALPPATAQKETSQPERASPPVAVRPKVASPPKVRKTDTVEPKIKAIVAELSGLEAAEIQSESSLADLGIDSLLGMELCSEIASTFQVSIPDEVLNEIIDLPGLVKVVRQYTSVGEDVEDDKISDSSLSDTSGTISDTSGRLTGISTPSAVPSEKDDGELELDIDSVIQAFRQTKQSTDARIVEYGQEDYATVIEPLQTQFCVVLTLDALDELGHSVRNATPGQVIERVPHAEQHGRLVDALYAMLDQEAGLIAINGATMTRTTKALPEQSSQALFEQLKQLYPGQSMADELTMRTGGRLADVLRGNTDGIKLIFGSAEGRKMVSHFYADWPLHRLIYRQLEDFITRLTSVVKNAGGDGVLRILEMGAGTGGTTKLLLPILAAAGIPVEYTFTDLAPSFTAAARKTFSSTYPFVKFRTHNIEDAPPDDLIGTQHVIVSSNAVHATRDLYSSTGNIRKALRNDGMLLLVEMTSRVWWMDLVFGLFEGWWLFDDGREYVVQTEQQWSSVLQSSGYGLVDWTDGARPENKLERLIVAFAAPSTRYAHLPITPPVSKVPCADLDTRQAAIDKFTAEFTAGFDESLEEAVTKVGGEAGRRTEGKCIVVTGCTGSLGAHLVAQLAEREDVREVVCLNRPKRGYDDDKRRQIESFEDKKIQLASEAAAKLTTYATDLGKPNLGLSQSTYDRIAAAATHIIHNAWLMNTKWPLTRFQPQLQIMKNMIGLAVDASAHAGKAEKVTFQLVSSIAAVGHWPVWSGTAVAPESRLTVDSVLPIGYGDAKHVCERMLDATLHQHPDRFRIMVVRPGQIAGHSTSGYWNTAEHISFLIKSSQFLGSLPHIPGHLAWAPVDGVAGTAIDLLFTEAPRAVYHIDNPQRQSWLDMIQMLAQELDIPKGKIVAFDEWVSLVRDGAKGGADTRNPAAMLADFFDVEFLHMSTGTLILGTDEACRHSPTLAKMKPVSQEIVRLYVQQWKDRGFLE
ncbi:hypothetical protein VHEMI01590 [[Torrubiella] hemipterigena]|uniref:Uncharacterized protein n=1 Tax=[Torrubiella] hemipterigena TaxID=1531966 RepID=A0A0A1SMB1_9HYPO|nr:hypothetical protein VHEMI01590 [[Torrubiella] hemipterigena]